MRVQRQILKLFPTVVSIYKNSDQSWHDPVRAAVLGYNKLQQPNPEFWQSDGLAHCIAGVEPMNEFILDCCDDYLKTLGCYRDELTISSAWANVSSGTVSTHLPHIHTNSLISAVYYLSCPSGTAPIYFTHPNPQQLAYEPDFVEPNDLNQTIADIMPEEGMCVVFRSTYLHGTGHNNFKGNEQRINVAYNVNMENLGHRRRTQGYS